MPLSMEVGLGLGHVALDGHPAPPPTERGTEAPTFWPMHIVAKRSPVSATAQLLLRCWRRKLFGLEDVLATSGGHTAALSCGFDFQLVFVALKRTGFETDRRTDGHAVHRLMLPSWWLGLSATIWS